MKPSDSFFSRKEQSEFIQRVYREAPAQIQWLFEKENEMLWEAVRGCNRVLEVGCGFGRAANHMDEKIQYTGIDIGFNYVVDALSRFPSRSWVCADAAHLPFMDRTFDAVFLIQNTLGNMEGIEAHVIAESTRVIRSQGKLIISAYSEDSFEVRRTWYDRLVDIGIFGRVWLDPANARMARSDTGWSSRCFDKEELKQYFGTETASLEIAKMDAFLYFCVGRIR